MNLRQLHAEVSVDNYDVMIVYRNLEMLYWTVSREKNVVTKNIVLCTEAEYDYQQSDY